MRNKENELIKIAQMSQSDEDANRAMRDLRNNYDETYGWCMDCDGLVVKKGDCCMNIKSDEDYDPLDDLCQADYDDIVNKKNR